VVAFTRFIPVSPIPALPISSFAYNFPVSPTFLIAYFLIAYFLITYFLFRLFPLSPISCFAYFPIVCSTSHARNRLSPPSRVRYGVQNLVGHASFYRCGEGRVLEYCTLKTEVLNPALLLSISSHFKMSQMNSGEELGEDSYGSFGPLAT
jgi:hypothetical protein